MALVVADKVLFVHIPKCGGTWARSALLGGAIPYQGEVWDKAPLMYFSPRGAESLKWNARRHMTPKKRHEYGAFMFVRPPEDWLRSYWHQRKRAGFDPAPVLAARFWSNDPDRFVAKVMDGDPTYVERLYRWYTKGWRDVFVGRLANIRTDLARALDHFKVRPEDPKWMEWMMEYPPMNVRPE